MNYQRVAKTDREACGWTKVALKNGDMALVLLPLPVRAVALKDLNLPLDCPLSLRELQVISCIADGMTNIQIGKALGLSWLIIKSHLSRIGARLGTGNRIRIVAIALRNKWIE